MPTLLTKDVECPECQTIIETEFEVEELDKEVTCPECQTIVPFEYDAATDTITIMEYEDDAGEDDEAEDFDEDEEEEDEG